MGCLTGAELLPDKPLTLTGAGNKSSGLSINADTPALADTSTSTGAPNPPLDGVMLARPLLSLVAFVGVTFRMTGMAGLPEFVSPTPAPGTFPPERITVVRKLTGAAKTGCGTGAESITRTVTG